MLTCWGFEHTNLAKLHTTSDQELICSVSVTSYELISTKIKNEVVLRLSGIPLPT